MPRLSVDRSSRIEPPSPRDPNCKRHPIYNVRRFSIVIAILGSLFFLFGFDASANGYLLYGSIFFSMIDLLDYAQDPEKHPKWPQKKFMFGDLAFAIVLQFNFWGAVVAISNMYYGYVVILCWAVLAIGICSCIHAYAFWKQLVAFYKVKWQTSLSKEPCVRCGYLDEDRGRSVKRRQPPNILPFVGPSAHCHQASVLTPDSQETAMEEGLLIDSDFGSSQDSVEVEPVLKAEEIVVTKGKSKKATGRGTKTDKS